MTTLYRCDWCWSLIDPIEGDEHARLTVELRVEGEQDSISEVDLCSECRPKSAGAHLDWVDYQKDEEG